MIEDFSDWETVEHKPVQSSASAFPPSLPKPEEEEEEWNSLPETPLPKTGVGNFFKERIAYPIGDKLLKPPEPKQISEKLGPRVPPDYGLRPGSNLPKGQGFFGELNRPGGGVSGELTIGVEMGGRSRNIPLMVPTLNSNEVDYLLKKQPGTGIDRNNPVEMTIMDKAIKHAEERIAAERSPYLEKGEYPISPKEEWTGALPDIYRAGKDIVKGIGETITEGKEAVKANPVVDFYSNLFTGIYGGDYSKLPDPDKAIKEVEGRLTRPLLTASEAELFPKVAGELGYDKPKVVRPPELHEEPFSLKRDIDWLGVVKRAVNNAAFSIPGYIATLKSGEVEGTSFEEQFPQRKGLQGLLDTAGDIVGMIAGPGKFAHGADKLLVREVPWLTHKITDGIFNRVTKNLFRTGLEMELMGLGTDLGRIAASSDPLKALEESATGYGIFGGKLALLKTGFPKELQHRFLRVVAGNILLGTFGSITKYDPEDPLSLWGQVFLNSWMSWHGDYKGLQEMEYDIYRRLKDKGIEETAVDKTLNKFEAAAKDMKDKAVEPDILTKLSDKALEASNKAAIRAGRTDNEFKAELDRREAKRKEEAKLAEENKVEKVTDPSQYTTDKKYLDEVAKLSEKLGPEKTKEILTNLGLESANQVKSKTSKETVLKNLRGTTEPEKVTPPNEDGLDPLRKKVATAEAEAVEKMNRYQKDQTSIPIEDVKKAADRFLKLSEQLRGELKKKQAGTTGEVVEETSGEKITIGIKPSAYTGEIPKEGFSVASIDENGMVYIGAKGENHGIVLDRYNLHDKKTKEGFVDSKGQFLTPEEAAGQGKKPLTAEDLVEPWKLTTKQAYTLRNRKFPKDVYSKFDKETAEKALSSGLKYEDWLASRGEKKPEVQKAPEPQLEESKNFENVIYLTYSKSGPIPTAEDIKKILGDTKNVTVTKMTAREYRIDFGKSASAATRKRAELVRKEKFGNVVEPTPEPVEAPKTTPVQPEVKPDYFGEGEKKIEEDEFSFTPKEEEELTPEEEAKIDEWEREFDEKNKNITEEEITAPDSLAVWEGIKKIADKNPFYAIGELMKLLESGKIDEMDFTELSTNLLKTTPMERFKTPQQYAQFVEMIEKSFEQAGSISKAPKEDALDEDTERFLDTDPADPRTKAYDIGGMIAEGFERVFKDIVRRVRESRVAKSDNVSSAEDIIGKIKSDVSDKATIDQKVSTKTITTEFTLDKTNILPTLLKDIANQNPSRTMIYELTQNSLDAMEKPGKIDISYDTYSSMLTFSDNGRGMSPQEVKKFFLVGGSIGKSGTDTRGGYGLAKIALLLIPERIKLTTYRNGIKSTVEATRDQIYSGKIQIVPEEAPGAENGTTFEAKLPREVGGRDISDYSVNDAVESVMRGTWTNSKISFGMGRYGHEVGKSSVNKGKLLPDEDHKIPFKSFSLDGSDVDIYFVKTEPYGYPFWGETYTVDAIATNKGLIVDIGSREFMKPNIHSKPDFKIVADFRRTPDVRDPRYPFLKNRTEIAYEFTQKIKKLVEQGVGEISSKVIEVTGKRFKEMVDKSPSFNGVKVLIPFTGEGFNKAKRVIDANIDLFNDFSKLTKQFTSLLIDTGETEVNFHLTIDPKVYGYKSNEKITGVDLYAINPFALDRYMETKTRLLKGDVGKLRSDAMVHTLAHEYAHKKEFNHSEQYAGELARIITVIGHESLYLLSKEMEAFYAKYGERVTSIGKDFDNLQISEAGLSEGFKGSAIRELPLPGETSVRWLDRGIRDYGEEFDKIGRGIYAEGYTSLSDFKRRLKEVAEDRWNDVESNATKLWNRARKWNKDMVKTGKVVPDYLNKTISMNLMIPLEQIPKGIMDFINDQKIPLNRLHRNHEIFKKFHMWLGNDNYWRYEIDDSKVNTDLLDRIVRHPVAEAFELREILPHSELFKIYPELEKMRVDYDPDADMSGYNPDEKRIVITSKGRKALFHEVQHAINDIVKTSFTGSSTSHEYYQFVTWMWAQLGGSAKNEFADLVNSELPNYGNKYSTRFMHQVVRPWLASYNALHNTSYDIPSYEQVFHQYLLNEGEMESRLVERRLGLTKTQRENTPPWKSLDRMLDEEGLSGLQLDNTMKAYSGIPIDEIGKMIGRVYSGASSLFQSAETRAEKRESRRFKDLRRKAKVNASDIDISDISRWASERKIDAKGIARMVQNEFGYSMKLDQLTKEQADTIKLKILSIPVDEPLQTETDIAHNPNISDFMKKRLAWVTKVYDVDEYDLNDMVALTTRGEPLNNTHLLVIMDSLKASKELRASKDKPIFPFFRPAIRIFGENFVGAFREAEVNYAKAIIPYYRRVHNIFKGLDYEEREAITKFREGELTEDKLSPKQLEVSRNLTKLYDELFDLFEIEKYAPKVENYSPRIGNAPTREQMVNWVFSRHGTANFSDFWAEHKRTGDLPDRMEDAFELANRYIRGGFRKKYFAPAHANAKHIMATFDKERKTLAEKWIDTVIKKQPTISEVLLNRGIRKFISAMGFRTDQHKRYFRDLVNGLLELNYSAFMGLRPKLSIRDLTQQVIIMNEYGYGAWARGAVGKYRKDVKAAMGKSVVIRGRLLEYLVEEGKMEFPTVTEKVRNQMMFMYRWSDSNNVRTAFATGYLNLKDINPNLTEADYIAAGEKAVRNTQWGYGIDLPYFFRTPTGKLLGQYSSWSFWYMDHLWRMFRERNGWNMARTTLQWVVAAMIYQKYGLNYLNTVGTGAMPQSFGYLPKTGYDLFQLVNATSNPDKFKGSLKKFYNDMLGLVPGALSGKDIKEFMKDGDVSKLLLFEKRKKKTKKSESYRLGGLKGLEGVEGL